MEIEEITAACSNYTGLRYLSAIMQSRQPPDNSGGFFMPTASLTSIIFYNNMKNRTVRQTKTDHMTGKSVILIYKVISAGKILGYEVNTTGEHLLPCDAHKSDLKEIARIVTLKLESAVEKESSVRIIFTPETKIFGQKVKGEAHPLSPEETKIFWDYIRIRNKNRT